MPGVNVVLVAEESAGANALRLLAERDERVLAVLTSPPPDSGTTAATVAAELGVARLDPQLVRDPAFADWLAEHEVDLLLNVHSLLVANGTVLEAPRIGSYNLHPGPLPRFAGLNAPSWAIAEGETRHAVTVHRMTAEVDAGDVAYEAWFDVGPRDTGLRVATRCVREGLPLLARLLDDAARGTIPAQRQPDGRRWFGREVPHDGRLPWQLGARRVVDLVRAADYAPFPSPWGTFATRVGDADVEIVRAARSGEPADAPAGTIGAPGERGVPVSAGDEWVVVERARRDGATTAPAEALPAGERCELPPDPAKAPLS